MDIFVLNSLYEKVDVLDTFSSFIWTERYSAPGDFKLVIGVTKRVRELLTYDSLIGHSETQELMTIENIEEKTENQEVLMTVSGRSLTSWLDSRAVKPWYESGTVPGIVTELVRRTCVLGTEFSGNDVIPGLALESRTGLVDHLYVRGEGGSLYSAVKSICDAHNVGFRIIYRKTSPRLVFETYTGGYRPNVVFSEDTETLVDPSLFKSREKFRNIAYVHHKNGYHTIPSPGYNVQVSGLRRRAMFVDAMDVDPDEHTPEELSMILWQRGREALARDAPPIEVYDGSASDSQASYKYKYQYNLGDVVVFRGHGGEVNQEVIVSEYIWSVDSQGTRGYPTFTNVDEDG